MSLAKRNAWLEIYNDYLQANKPAGRKDYEVDEDDAKYYKSVKT